MMAITEKIKLCQPFKCSRFGSLPGSPFFPFQTAAPGSPSAKSPTIVAPERSRPAKMAPRRSRPPPTCAKTITTRSAQRESRIKKIGTHLQGIGVELAIETGAGHIDLSRDLREL